MRNIYTLIPVLALWVVVAGCDSNILQDTKEQGNVQQQVPTQVFGNTTLQDLQDIPPLQVDLPAEPRSWDTNVSVLRDSIAANDGRAMIGLKAPGSERMRANNGIREALTAREFEAALQMLADRDIEIRHVFRTFGAASVQMDPDKVFDLFDHPMVDYIEIPVEYRLQSSLMSGSKDLYKMQAIQMSAQQTIPWGISMVRAPDAWSITTGSAARVSVIDTGMENHEDLPNRPASNCGGLHDGCSDGPIFHGTHVSGSLMALDNSFGVVGVAPGIADNDVYSWGACSPITGVCDNDAIAAGIEASMFADVDVINMSLGGPIQHTGTANAVAAAWNAGIVLVAAAGNIPENQQGGDVVYPANYSQVIGVSGVNEDGMFADTSPCIFDPNTGERWKSNHGSHVDISGPFWALSSVGTSDYEDENDGWCGTSMATPHVSGAAALLRAQNPGWTNQQIVDQLLATANHPTSSTRDDFFGHGILDVLAALGGPPLEVTITGPTFLEKNQMGTWTANVENTSGSVSYQWFYTDSSTSDWIPAGSNSDTFSHAFTVTSNTSTDTGVRVDVTSGNEQDTDILYVFVTSEDCDPVFEICEN